MTKRMLFIAPKFYSYHILMKNAFEKKGFIVDYYDDRPGDTFVLKAMLRINKRLVKRKINNYFATIINEIKSKTYDFIFVIYGQSFTIDMIEKIKSYSPNAYSVFYMYDPIISMPDRVEFAKKFDKAYTFDILDYEKYEVFEFLPLFYAKHNYEKREILYDYCILTTMMPGKYEKICNMINEIKAHNPNVRIFNFQFLQSKLVWLYYRLRKREFKKTRVNQFKYKRLSYDDSNRILEMSNIIIDCPKTGQSGLTIRTLECLAASKKLITTNQTIKKYDFYRPENIYVYDGKNKMDYNDVFFKSNYVEINSNVLEKYSIDNWCQIIINSQSKE